MSVINQLVGLGGVLRHGRTIVLFSALVTTAIGATSGFLVWHSHESALEEHERSMNSMGIVLAEQTSRHAQVIDLILQDVQSQIAKLNITTLADFDRQLQAREVHLALGERLKNVPQADALVVVDANGLVVNGSRTWPAERVDLSDRDYFKYFKQHDDPGLFVGSLAKNRGTGRPSLYFSRRISGPDGSFFGLVVAVVDTRSLVAFHAAAGEHLDQSVTLLRRDGTLLMQYPDAEKTMGVKIPLGSPWYLRVAEGGGSYVLSEAVDGVAALVSVHPLIDYPLVVDTMMNEADIFARWYKETFYTAIVALAALLMFACLFSVLALQFRRQAEQNMKWAETSVRLREGQEMLRAYAEMSADWFWEQDADFRFKSKTLIPFMTASDDSGKTRWELAGAAMSEDRWAPHKADLAARRPFRNFRWERVDENGVRHFMVVSGDPVFDQNGDFVGYRGTGREITAEVKATAQLAHANYELELGRQQFDAVLNNITQGVCFFDGNKRLLLWNRRYAEIYKLPPEATRVGRSLEEILSYREAAGTAPDMSPSEFLGWREQLAAEALPSGGILALRNGRYVAISYQPMPGDGWVATHEDVTERQQAEAKMVFMARHDALTKLPNRVLFRERMEQAIAMMGRGARFAVFCLDLDKFKQVNDALGHPAGDTLLVAVANRLQDCVREADTVARLGGDEFAIIQVAVQQPEDSQALAGRIIAAFRQPYEVGDHLVMSGVSIGVTVAPENDACYESLMRDADIALYLAKTEGRGTARFFEPEMDARIKTRRALELDLQGALARDEFELFYQPQVNLVSNRVSGFEALLRWHHPVRGFVSPTDFIPVAEETGLIVAIGEWVLRTACFEAENWPADISVAVNLSPIQFKAGELAATVQSALTASGLPPHRLELEITESVFLRDTTATLTALHQFRAMGICIALDDFGTGYSSLSYLRSFPFSKLKIDQSFVRDLMTNRESMSIIRAVTGLGQSLGVRTMAEGVETVEQLERLREEGCTEVQGHFFSRPRPASEVPFLIEKLQRIGTSKDSIQV